MHPLPSWANVGMGFHKDIIFWLKQHTFSGLQKTDFPFYNQNTTWPCKSRSVYLAHWSSSLKVCLFSSLWFLLWTCTKVFLYLQQNSGHPPPDPPQNNVSPEPKPLPQDSPQKRDREKLKVSTLFDCDVMIRLCTDCKIVFIFFRCHLSDQQK